MTGTLTLAGKTYPVNVVMQLVDAAPPDAAVNIWLLLTDLAALTAAVLAKNALAIAQALAKLLADLGLQLTSAQKAAIIDRLNRANASGSGSTELYGSVARAIADANRATPAQMW